MSFQEEEREKFRRPLVVMGFGGAMMGVECAAASVVLPEQPSQQADKIFECPVDEPDKRVSCCLTFKEAGVRICFWRSLRHDSWAFIAVGVAVDSKAGHLLIPAVGAAPAMCQRYP